MIDTVRVSPAARDQLIALKRRTGLKHWNELCRWALCRSLAERSVPSDVPIPVDQGLEIEWRTFAGRRSDLYLDLVKARCRRDGLPDDPDVVAKQFRLHLHRGIGYLAGDRKLKTTDSMLELALRGSGGGAPDPAS